MGNLAAGKPAPLFTLSANDGRKVALKDFQGKKRVVLYFYPKDDTPGCTVEACGFRDHHKQIENESAVVLGISPDGVDRHQKFIEKFKLPFLLLADEAKEVCQKYGVWVKKSMYGKSYMGVARTTFIIGKDGKIEKIYEKVKPEGHDKEVLSFLKEASS
ncbi:MAG: thioredoxin-dependent thiol peroxidase [Candidatus Omnitrophica bacterium CG11_big_fil_rev_8_21_14_0_20_45_26]|uniref:thioredoxin-dependent peroxiredoxin n=1 Tax=Candidatus Abzuiibacterium crystallinum TaxID=1974748 RepID=A0A2H0LNN2_9BACT|nr:MAG: thioredoxin-dependent thiol peroxidase [Candidatus Omnitrophica bacterium CG11_big_fil_rev_8_21_14_0_20_45_26]PIW65667.1 MAG: thioredoxin-dependent thiol peroxidase [Candidatus Omnitrophica bacterium CG12_big_fil_rev_8_21_14_0_65_45_16]